MATLRSRWLLTILMFSLPQRFASTVSPASPSNPECCFRCDEYTCEVDIHCTWDPRLDPEIPSNYSLYWETANSEIGHVISTTRWNGSIHRKHFQRNEELHVWVEAQNQHGSARSQKITFNTEDINKPPPPTLTLNHQESFEFEWSSICQPHLPIMSCEVQCRTDANPVWLPPEDGFIDRYFLEEPQSCTVYEFQVRCTCKKGKTSNWSKILRIPFLEAVPSGQLDIWTDCGFSLTGNDCVLMWKKPTISQACGHILRYEIKLSYNNATVLLMNVSAEGPSSQLVCDGMLCYLNTSLIDVSSVSASVFNSQGGTVPVHLAMPVLGVSYLDCHKSKAKDEQTIDARMDEENLTVSWHLTPHLFYNVSEIVVQYKQVGCPPGQGFDWIKVNKKQTGFFKGQFKELTPYKVSLFTVSQSREVYHLSSVIVYALQGTPPQVPSFRVFSIGATHVTLFWEPIPLSQQNGVIQYYETGVDEHIVHNVSSGPWCQNYTFDVSPLNPDQDYKAWIRAVTAAGPGENNTTNFKTTQHETYGHMTLIYIGLALCLICLIFPALILFRKQKLCPSLMRVLCEKVPDPRNSHVCRNMKPQNHESLTWLCKSAYEPHPKITILQIVEKQPGASKCPQKKTSNLNGQNVSTLENGCSQIYCEEAQKEDVITEDCDRTDHRYEEEYSKMVDSDEEKDKVGEEDSDDCSDSSEDFTSGYEKHFMPTVREILEVS